MKLILKNHDFRYETENLLRVFFSEEKIEVDTFFSPEENVLITEVFTGEQENRYRAFFHYNGKEAICERKLSVSADEHEQEKALALCEYEVLKQLTGYEPVWGILTGVRPAKLMSKLCRELGKEQAKDYFQKEFLVSEPKARLALSVAEKESEIIDLPQEKSFSLYVSIPFCPTRCSYCSFVSHSNQSAKKLIPTYLDYLCREIEQTARVASDLGLRLETVYYGGGTPTVLSAPQLERVMATVQSNFDLSTIREYTVEAGRPDSITPDKLEVISRFGADRISINPQTFSDPVLETIGRHHTCEQTLSAYEMAKQAGFQNINMDLIAGLPGDTLPGFCHTIETTLSLAPQSITVHTLALKRSSGLVTNHEKTNEAKTAAQMLDYAQPRLYESGYLPYYMYRQSKMLGNLENVGWAKPGFESLYNVFMMEETHSILAVGGAAVTKLKAPHSSEIERIFNFKYPYEYIERFEELLRRKEGIVQFYQTHL